MASVADRRLEPALAELVLVVVMVVTPPPAAPVAVATFLLLFSVCRESCSISSSSKSCPLAEARDTMPGKKTFNSECCG
ncbi:hypothetical protein M5D96_001862 [Drosophila gunungcola]|uniref:Uncharacterized protein n=1 Tax=Drosophila gunungcola TaxID=103775 RepID=A0A9Q0BVU0_9MUSC|nr:hypothetical protein M5D96_001862 [Drosophila gunungcola]